MNKVSAILIFLTLLIAHVLSGAVIETDSVVIAAVGDVMPGTDYPSDGYLPPGNDCGLLFKDSRTALGGSDIVFCNLEGTFAGDYGNPKQCDHCFSFRIPESYAACLSEAGFNLISLANNHAFDFGPEGYRNSLKVIRFEGMSAYGLKGEAPVIIKIRGQRIGFYAFTYNPGFNSIRDIRETRRLIQELSSQTSIVLVSFHGGAEGREYQHIPGRAEYFLGENRGDVLQFAHAAVEAGADLVIGHGPHVPRGIELYKDRLIAYSLGNFCTYGRFNLRGPNCIAPVLRICLNPEGELISGKIISFIQKGRGGPVPDKQQRAVEMIRELTQTDFPDTNLDIDAGGRISIRNKPETDDGF